MNKKMNTTKVVVDNQKKLDNNTNDKNISSDATTNFVKAKSKSSK